MQNQSVVADLQLRSAHAVERDILDICRVPCRPVIQRDLRNTFGQ
jgi:hypothetical protein